MSALNWLKLNGAAKAPRRIPGDRGPAEPVLGRPRGPDSRPEIRPAYEPEPEAPKVEPRPRTRPAAARAPGRTQAPPRPAGAPDPVLSTKARVAPNPHAADKPRRSRLRRRTMRALVAGGLLSLLAGGAALTSDWFETLPAWASHQLALAMADAGLTVQNVTVIGRHDTPSTAVLDALGVRRGDPILDIDPEQARIALEQLGWVKQARVRRALPDTLHIELIERRPMAIWQHQGVIKVIDHDGKVIGENGEQFRHELPLVVGEDAPAKAADLLKMLSSQPALAQRVVASIRVGGRRWNLKLDNEVEVRLPAENPEGAYAELARLDQHYGLLGRDVVGIDLRLPDRLVVQLSSGAMQTRMTSGKDT